MTNQGDYVIVFEMPHNALLHRSGQTITHFSDEAMRFRTRWDAEEYLLPRREELEKLGKQPDVSSHPL